MKDRWLELRNKDSFKSVISSLIAILVGLIVGIIIIFIASPSDIGEGVKLLFTGAFEDGLTSFGQVIYLSMPIMMTGLSVAFAYKCGEFNIGVPGQYLVGSFVSMIIVIRGTFLPDSIAWLVGILCAGLAGAIWALIPGLLKAFKNVNVVISGIMCNYIGLLLCIQGVKSFIYQSEGAQSLTVSQSRAIPSLGLSDLFGGAPVNLGFIIAILLCILAWVIMNKTTFGFELKACGLNKNAAKYAGMDEKKCIVLAIAIAGFFAGVGGSLPYLSGTGKALQIVEELPAEGFNGIPIALLGFSNPIGCIFAALFIAYINVGGTAMQSLNIAIEVIDVIVAVIIYFSSFSLFIKLLLGKRNANKLNKKKTEGGEK